MNRCGWKKDPPSAKDWHASRLLGAAPPAPVTGSLVPRILAPPLDQTNEDCTANSTAKAIQISLTPEGGPCPELVSRRFGYYEGGVPEGSQKQDDGRYLRDVLTAYSALGMPPESAWPYDKPFDQHPATEAFRQGFDARLQWHRIPSGPGCRDLISRAIAGGFPVVVGAPVTAAWRAQDGVTPFDVPAADDAVIGGHAFAIVGYDEQGFRFINSWGPSWGSNGYGYCTWAWGDSQLEDILVIDCKPEAA